MIADETGDDRGKAGNEQHRSGGNERGAVRAGTEVGDAMAEKLQASASDALKAPATVAPRPHRVCSVSTR